MGGVWVAVRGGLAETQFQLFGTEFSSTSVGVSIAFLGAVMVTVAFRRRLGSIDHLAALPEDPPR